MYLLFQLLDLVGRASMAQVDLQVYHHLGQEFSNVEGIARQVGACILERVVEKRKKPLTKDEEKKILVLYQENGNQMIDKSEDCVSELRESREFGGPEKLVYAREEEEEHLRRFIKVLEDVLSEKTKEEIIMLTPWSEIKERTGKYFVLREMLRRRSNQSTWARLKECGLIGRPR